MTKTRPRRISYQYCTALVSKVQVRLPRRPSKLDAPRPSVPRRELHGADELFHLWVFARIDPRLAVQNCLAVPAARPVLRPIDAVKVACRRRAWRNTKLPPAPTNAPCCNCTGAHPPPCVSSPSRRHACAGDERKKRKSRSARNDARKRARRTRLADSSRTFRLLVHVDVRRAVRRASHGTERERTGEGKLRGRGRMERRRGESISRAGAFRRVLRRGDGTRVLELTSTRISRGFFAAHLQAVVAEGGLHRGV